MTMVALHKNTGSIAYHSKATAYSQWWQYIETAGTIALDHNGDTASRWHIIMVVSNDNASSEFYNASPK